MNGSFLKNIKGLSSLIGNTPLLEIEFLYKGKNRKIYASIRNVICQPARHATNPH